MVGDKGCCDEPFNKAAVNVLLIDCTNSLFVFPSLFGQEIAEPLKALAIL